MRTSAERIRLSLEQPVVMLPGVGTQSAKCLERIDIRQVKDVLLHIPSRHIDRSRLQKIGAIRAGQELCVQGTIHKTIVQRGAHGSLLCYLVDGSGELVLRFFHHTKYHRRLLVKGKTLRCYGTAKEYRGQLQMVHPEYQALSDPDIPLEDSLTPIYPLTQGIRQQAFRKISAQALGVLERADSRETELLPEALLPEGLHLSFVDAVRYVHRPAAGAGSARIQQQMARAKQRLALEELLAHHLSLTYIRRQYQHRNAPRFVAQPPSVRELIKRLPFRLTVAQHQAWQEICSDLQRDQPMMRLLQGDVGCGKTIVATLGALHAIDSGCQVALLAPTELLSEQHHQNLSRLLEPLGIKPLLLSGAVRGGDRKSVLEALADTRPLLAIGTHALFQDQVKFGCLGLVIIDEQHRFGVQQRTLLMQKGLSGDRFPHQLIMTATPIPRTLTLSLYADLDCSVIDRLPPGRKPVQTVVISNERRAEVMQRIVASHEQFRQAYWVCPLIDESDKLELETVHDTCALLSDRFPELHIGMVHGRMNRGEKECQMQRFKSGEYDILVATTVIEVGVDVPNANLMIIDNAERLGLAQLHQLRGRVGRGAERSTCVLMYQKPLGDIARQRLDILRRSGNGFEIAEKDLELRGAGELLGIKQTGLPDMRFADLGRDGPLLPHLRKLSQRLLKQRPDLVEPLIHRWLGKPATFSNL